MGFDWDAGNLNHIAKRNITPAEVEEAILDPSRAGGRSYSVGGEWRDAIIGMTNRGLLLHVVYTEPDGRLRPLHVRNARRTERGEYEGR